MSAIEVIASSRLVTEADDGKAFLVDSIVTTWNLTFDPSPNGYAVDIKKIDASSNPVYVHAPAGGTLDRFYQYRSLNVTQDSVRVAVLGSDAYTLAGSFHKSLPRSHRTVQTPTYNVHPVNDIGELIRCDCASAGQDIGVYLPPLAQVTQAGNYQGHLFEVMKADTNASRYVAIFPQDGEMLNGYINTPQNPAPGSSQKRIFNPFETIRLYAASDRWWGVRLPAL